MTAALVLAHRGAPGYLPDHTIAGYTRAIELGADYIEPDLVSTKDGVLVARHENELSLTTDVAARFPDRRTTKVVDGKAVEGWFVEDLTLAEVRTLRARQPLPFRDHAHDGVHPIPTFDEVLDLAVAKSRETGRRVGVIPETKHPSYFDGLGLSLEEPMLRSLVAHGYTTAADPVWIQSFEAGNLVELGAATTIRRARLIDGAGPIPDAELQRIAGYAQAIGVHKSAVVGDDGVATDLVARAHARGLEVQVYTFRSEAQYLPAWAAGDPVAELRRFYALGVDAVFADFPDVAVRAR